MSETTIEHEPDEPKGEHPPPAKVPDPAHNTPFNPGFTTAADTHDVKQEGAPRPGLSFSPGLTEVPNSKVPANARGDLISHVWGPQQAAVDPIAAGLDTEFKPLTRHELRITTQTGILGAGTRPATYGEKGPPGWENPQAAPADGTEVKPAPEAESAKAPGPSGAPSTG